METMIYEIDDDDLDSPSLGKCADILRRGGTVAFPTETVYGLGANGLMPEAIRKIYQVKGRPSDNPLILHIAHIAEIQSLVETIPQGAQAVMDEFWPGPLTLIFKKSPLVPSEITGGLDTVAIRMPSHPIARRLIELAGIPLAAPSANLSGKPSPTASQHVIKDLKGRVDAIVAGGNCEIGLESTVLDMTQEPPMILRPGGVTREMLLQVLPQVSEDPTLKGAMDPHMIPKAPGMKYTHYAPEASVILVNGAVDKAVDKIKALAQRHSGAGLRVGIICSDETRHYYDEDWVIKSIGSRQDPKTIAVNLFKILREFDETDVQIILSETVEAVGLGQAVMNRLLKASGYQLIQV